MSLTSSSVPGLDRSSVTVADSNGDLLAGPGVNDTGAGQTSAQSAFDSSQADKVAAYLSSILGPNNADVQVNATLNFDQTSSTSNLILNGKNGKPQTVCTSTQGSSTKYTGTGTPTGVQAGTTTGGNGSYNQSSSTKTCETSTETVQSTVAPGGITRQSVAVLVNAKALPKGVSLATLQKGVAAAVGLNTGRGDVLTFSSLPFKSSATPAAKTAKKSMLTSYLKPGLAFLLLLVVLFLLWRASRRARKQAAATDSVMESMLLDRFNALSAIDPTTNELPAIQFAPQRRLGPSVHDIVDSQSEDVAAVLRDWLHQPS